MKKAVIILVLILSICIIPHAQIHQVSGHVELADEGVVPGIPVVEVDTKYGAVTDIDGNFKMTVRNSPPRLLISYVGYKDTIVVVKYYEQPINIVLQPLDTDLE